MRITGRARLGGELIELEADAATYDQAYAALVAQVPEGARLLFVKQ